MIVIKGIKANGEQYSIEIEKSIQTLSLEFNQLASIDLSPLKECTELQWLNLNRNQLASIDISPLKACTKLQKLVLAENQLASIDISPLKACTKLQELWLNRNQLASIDLSPLKECTKLQELGLSANQLASIDLSPLKECTKLQRLWLNGNQLASIDISPLKECTKLRELGLPSNQLASIDISPLKECTKLQELGLNGNQLASIDISPLKECTKLRELGLSSNQLASIDLSPLKECTELQGLGLSSNQLASIDLSPLKECTELQSLGLYENQLASIDLSPLKECTELQSLMLHENQLKRLDVTALKKGIKLEVLFIDANVTLFWREEALPKKDDLPKGLQEHYTRLIIDKQPTMPTTIIQRLKVFCVGVAGSGKTSLLKRIQNEPYIEGRKETIGLDIAKISLEQLSESTVDDQERNSNNVMTENHQLIWWDYGGQGGYLPTHRFFFTRDAIYLFFMRVDQDIEQSKVIDWLSSIRSRCPYARIIPIASWSDRLATGGVNILSGSQGRELKKILHEYNVNYDPILLSNKEENNAGVRKLKRLLADLLQFRGATYQLPLDYKLLEQFVINLKEQGKVFLQREEFTKLLTDQCSNWEGISPSWIQEMAVYQLHEHGLILYTNELLPTSDLVVVNVDQANKILATIVDESAAKPYQGRMTINEIKKVLTGKFDISHQWLSNVEEVIDLLEELGLACKDHTTNDWIFPLYVEEPKPEWQKIKTSWQKKAYTKISCSINTTDETLFSRMLHFLSFQGTTFGIWKQEYFKEKKTTHHGLIAIQQRETVQNIETINQGLLFTLQSSKSNINFTEFSVWFVGLTFTTEKRLTQSLQRYLRYEYNVQDFQTITLNERPPSLDYGEQLRELEQRQSFVEARQLSVEERMDSNYKFLNAELRKTNMNMDDLKSCMDDNICQIKDFIAQIGKKLPVPKEVIVERKLLVRKQFKLLFVCEGKREGCLHSPSNPFEITIGKWARWLKLSLLSVKLGVTTFKTVTGDISSPIDTIKDIYKELKTGKDPDFLSFASQLFLTSEERDMLITELREQEFFKHFDYNPQQAFWICESCPKK